MTREQFIDREIRIWGVDYIADLFAQGYEIVQSVDTYGNVKFGWLLPQVALTA